MLTIFRRHLKACPQKSRRYRRCSCPIWIEGSIGEERVSRRALNLTSWQAAEDYVHESTAAGRLGGARTKTMPVSDAVDLYLQDVAARVRASSVKLYRVLLKDSLAPWCEANGFHYMKELDVATMISYRATWQYAPLTALKKFERLRAFFRFCFTAKWIGDNPMAAMKAPRANTPPTMPFTDEEMRRILAAARGFTIQGTYGRHNPLRVEAFILLLRYSGLRISDAASLSKERLTPDGRLFLHMQQKTRVPVYVPLPPVVIAAVRELAKLTTGKDHYFWSGNGKLETGVKSWRRTLARIFAIAGVKSGHAHRFRDTFAVSLLLKGVPLEDVAELLGHKSTKVTEQSYAPWVKARQDKLEERVRRTWPDEQPKPTPLKDRA